MQIEKGVWLNDVLQHQLLLLDEVWTNKIKYVGDQT